MRDSNSVLVPDLDDSQITRTMMVLTLATDGLFDEDEDVGTDPYNTGIERVQRKWPAKPLG